MTNWEHNATSWYFCLKWNLNLLIYFKYLFIWLCQVLAAVCRIFSCGIQILSCCIWDLVPWSNLGPLHWELGILATGLPRKPQKLNLILRKHQTNERRPHITVGRAGRSLAALMGAALQLRRVGFLLVAAFLCFSVLLYGALGSWHVGSFWTRDWTRVPCIDRWVLIRCTSGEAQCAFLKKMSNL